MTASRSRLLNSRGVVEALAHRVGLGRVLVQDLQVQLIGPPVGVRGESTPGAAIVRDLAARGLDDRAQASDRVVVLVADQEQHRCLGLIGELLERTIIGVDGREFAATLNNDRIEGSLGKLHAANHGRGWQPVK
jgi:hypothetical protein